MQQAQALPPAALEDLIARARRLERTLEAADPEGNKVSLFRLRKCRGLFEYLRDLKAAEAPAPPPP